MVKKQTAGMTFWEALQKCREGNLIGRRLWAFGSEILYLSFNNKTTLSGPDGKTFALTQPDYFATDWVVKVPDPVKIEGWLVIFQDGSILSDNDKLFKTYDDASNNTIPENRNIIFISQTIPNQD